MAEVLLKICGLTREEDVRLCHELGAGFTGFIMVPASPRFLAPRNIAAMPRGRAKRVGVVTGGTVPEVRKAASLAGLDYVQLHGGQSPEFCAGIGAERVIKVLWPEKMTGEALQREITAFAPHCAYFLFDAGTSGGGSGRSFSWEVLRDVSIPRPWFLAGGIDPENAAEAIRACSPSGLDVSSGVESAPGVKDAEKLRALARQLQEIQKEHTDATRTA